MNNPKYKHDKQQTIHPQQDQQQKTRQSQEANKQGRRPDMLHKDLDHQQIHEHELIETRLTR